MEKAIEDPMLDLDPEDGETFHASVYVFPQLLAVSHDELTSALDMDGFETLDEIDDINSYIKVLTRTPQSAHEEVEQMPELAECMRALSSILEQESEDGSAVNFTLT